MNSSSSSKCGNCQYLSTDLWELQAAIFKLLMETFSPDFGLNTYISSVVVIETPSGVFAVTVSVFKNIAYLPMYTLNMVGKSKKRHNMTLIVLNESQQSFIIYGRGSVIMVMMEIMRSGNMKTPDRGGVL